MASASPNGQFYYMPSTAAFPALLAIGVSGQSQGTVWSQSVENDGGSAYEVWTVQASGTSAASFSIYPANDTGQAVTISGAAAASATLVATNLKAALEANAVAFGLVSVTQVTDTLTLTGRTVGQVIVVDSAVNCVLVNSTDAAAAERVPAGVAIIRTGRDDTGNTQKGRRAIYTAFTAQAGVFTFSGISGGRVGVNIQFAGQTIPVYVPYNASLNQTVTDLVAAVETAMNAAFPAAQSVVATNPSNAVMTLTADVAGASFYAVADVGPATAGVVTVVWNGGDTTPTYENPTYSLAAAYLGTSMFDYGLIETSPGAADPAIPAGANMRVACGGPGYVPVRHSATAPSFGAGAWVDATSSDSGRGYYYFAASASSKRIPLWLPNRGWLAIASGDNDSTNGLAGLRNLVLNG